MSRTPFYPDASGGTRRTTQNADQDQREADQAQQREQSQAQPSAASGTADDAQQAPTFLEGRAKNLALTGIFLSMAVSMLSMTVVGSSMPLIIADLGGTQAAFTWVVTATMLASAVSTPIWGKLADLTNKKTLLQVSLILFTVGSLLAGLAPSSGWLIAFRVIQGLGAGGIGALGQIVLAEVLSPRERGRYMGIMGAIMAVSTVGGPLLGGWITDTIGWRWNFSVAVPVAILAILFLQFTLKLHTVRGKIKIDYLGAALITAGFSSLLVWVTLAGSTFAWVSAPSFIMSIGGVVLLGLAVIVELKAEEPLIPLTLFKNRTFTLSVIASIAVGLAMFGTSVFLGQYMQLARGKTPTESGLLTIPMMAGVLIASTLIGQIISRTGKWKRYVVSGTVIMFIGLFMMGQLRYDTSYWFVGVSMFVLGAGVGMSMQNLVLIVQNTVEPTQLGAASAGVTFFRTIGGTAGMSVMGMLLGTWTAQYIQEELAKLDTKLQAGAEVLASGVIPKLADLPEPIRLVVETAYGHGIGNVFLAASPVAVIAILAAVFLPNIPLKTQSNQERLAELRAEQSVTTHTGAISKVAQAETGSAETLPAETGSTETAAAPPSEEPRA